MKVIAVIREKWDNLEGKEFCESMYTFEKVIKEIIYKSDFVYATLPQTSKKYTFLMLFFFLIQ